MKNERIIQAAPAPCNASQAARTRLLSLPGEPLFIADWDRALMIHYEVEATALQREVPFELDLWEGRAFVSMVAFTLRDMRPRLGGKIAGQLLKPIATHGFLNVRTYVRQGREAGIFFLAEWLSNRLSVALGPTIFGLPYRFGKLEYNHTWEMGKLTGRVSDNGGGGVFSYEALMSGWCGCSVSIGEREQSRDGSATVPDWRVCETGTLTEWLMERYTAFMWRKGRARFFRVWHPPWKQLFVEAEVRDKSLLDLDWPFFRDAVRAGANFSRGLCDVWMGRPHRSSEK